MQNEFYSHKILEICSKLLIITSNMKHMKYDKSSPIYKTYVEYTNKLVDKFINFIDQCETYDFSKFDLCITLHDNLLQAMNEYEKPRIYYDGILDERLTKIVNIMNNIDQQKIPRACTKFVDLVDSI